MKKRVALVIKRSTWDRAKEHPDDEIHALLERRDPTVASVMASHEEHAATVKEVKAHLHELGVDVTHIRKRRETFDDGPFDLVITVGGDGTLLQASHSVADTPVLGINSAPSSSMGFFCGGQNGAAGEAIDAALAGKLKGVVLARMMVRVNDEVVHGRVLNDALVCHESPAVTSRYILEHGDEVEEQKSSGFWIGPAAGSTAAQRSAGGKVLPLGSKQLQLVVREPYRPRGEPYRLTRLLVKEGTAIGMRSKARRMRMYFDGPIDRAKLALGDVVEFSLSPEPLLVLGIASRRREWS